MRTLMALAMLCGVARADPVADAMHEYYQGEQEGAGLFMGTGLAATAVGGGLLAMDDARASNAAYALFAVAAIEIAAGAVLLPVSRNRLRKLDVELARDRNLMIANERSHMDRVDKQFIFVEVVEGLVTAAGAATLGAGLGTSDDTLIGVGAGLAAQGVAMFLLDLASHRRALRYRRALAP